jgi:hypothetical protein
VAMLIGVAVPAYLFANDYPFYVGPIANNNPQIGDITFILAFVLTGALYYAFQLATRGQAGAAGAAGSRAA